MWTVGMSDNQECALSALCDYKATTFPLSVSAVSTSASDSTSADSIVLYNSSTVETPNLLI